MGLSPQLLREFPRWEDQLSAECLLSIAEKLRSNSPALVRGKYQGKRDGQGCLATHCGWGVYGENAPGAGRRFLKRLGFNPRKLTSALVHEWERNLRDPRFRAELARLFERAARKKRPSRAWRLWGLLDLFSTPKEAVMNPENERRFLRALAVPAPAFTREQAARVLSGGDLSNLSRAVRPLVERDQVRTVELVARPVPTLTEPKAVGRPGGAEPDFGRAIYLAGLQWRDASAQSMTVYTATPRTLRLFGGRRSRQVPLAEPLKASHSLTLAELFLWWMEHLPEEAERFCGEGFVDLHFGDRAADAAILTPENRVAKVLEVCSPDYSKQKLQELWRGCDERGLELQVW